MDSHLYEGYTVPPNYDSLIAKVLAHGATREQAIARLGTALHEIQVEGVRTTVPLHRRILQDPGFVRGGFDIHYLERRLPELTQEASSA